MSVHCGGHENVGGMNRDGGQQHTVVSISRLVAMLKPKPSQWEPSALETAASEFFCALSCERRNPAGPEMVQRTDVLHDTERGCGSIA
ncbi:hypothetical protein Hgul01_05394 [Herpetosiphon gulosus]|uniref:Uncharacterized protein n=1 Tax=Herpetosiphon gulosus TaxID=1973496 RepID=A0ABP9X847_9CHLR